VLVLVPFKNSDFEDENEYDDETEKNLIRLPAYAQIGNRAISTFKRGGDHGLHIFQFGVGGDIAAGLQDKTLRA